MKAVVVKAANSNLEIGGAMAKRVGIEFKLNQVHGRYRPRSDFEVDVEGNSRQRYHLRQY